MPPELLTTLSNDNLYRFIDPQWSPGKTSYMHTHPEYEAQDWDAFEIMILDSNYPGEQVWRTLLAAERENLDKHHWIEIFQNIQAWAESTD